MSLANYLRDGEPGDSERWKLVTAALDANDEPRALELLRDLAGQGDSRASASLAYVYEAKGRTDPQNYSEAAHWYAQALVQGDRPEAHLGLARYYFYGLGGAKDHNRAKQHLERADPDRNPQAALMLGHLYHRSPQRPEDITRAKALYDIAAASGYPFAMMELANIYKSERRWLKAFKHRCAAITQLVRLRLSDERDVRLMGFLRPESRR
jgi:hypothetical protein